ncbi:MAG: hypothetical protein OXP12_07495 [Thaumarchaeota archaeon]|nr:hypothetical protein [Nitrososphaerota archaeon]
MKAVLVALVLAAACVLAAGHQAHAETQTLPTEQGTLDVQLVYDDVIMPGEETKIKVDFLNPVTGQTQVHIDYTITITRDGEQVFGPTDLIHTSPGTITLPVQFRNAGVHSLGFTVEGIWFQPIPAEAVSFEIPVGEDASAPAAAPDTAVIPPWVKSNAGWWADGLIDDATFVSGIEYLIQSGILVVPAADAASDPGSDADGGGGGGEDAPGPQIPPWVKSNAGWWADGLIDDATFVGALQFLITAGIIQV